MRCKVVTVKTWRTWGKQSRRWERVLGWGTPIYPSYDHHLVARRPPYLEFTIAVSNAVVVRRVEGLSQGHGIGINQQPSADGDVDRERGRWSDNDGIMRTTRERTVRDSAQLPCILWGSFCLLDLFHPLPWPKCKPGGVSFLVVRQ